MKNFIELKVKTDRIGLLNDILGKELEDLKMWQKELPRDKWIAEEVKAIEGWLNQIRANVLG